MSVSRSNCRKAVQFSEDVKIHYIYHWSYAHRTARHGNWMQDARDRERFRMKILRYAQIINPVLEHKYFMSQNM